MAGDQRDRYAPSVSPRDPLPLGDHLRPVDQIKTVVTEELLAILLTGAFDACVEVGGFTDGRPRTLRELSELTHLEQSTINRQVNAAITHGYLERFDVAGSTSRRIRPTQRGVEAFEHDGLLRARRLERVLSDMAPGTPEALLRELHAFNEAYDRLDEPAGTSATGTSATGPSARGTSATPARLVRGVRRKRQS
ncbi:MarR family transcriptional regulator [Gordonia sp. NPDC003429]